MSKNLSNIQQRFLNNIIYKQTDTDDYQDGIFSAKHLLQVYQNNYTSTLIAALKSTYNAVYRLVGEAFFNHLAQAYIQAYPVKTGNIKDYGHYFPIFIAQFKACRSLPYLSDIAQLECYYEQCYNNKSCHYDLGEHYPNFDIKRLTPALIDVYLLQSDYPIIAIWQLDEDSPLVDLQQGGDNMLLYRFEYEIKILKLPLEMFHYLSNLKKE